MNLKIGGSNVGKIMYGGQEFGGATKLESGTILYISKIKSYEFENAHLLSATKKWENINGINVATCNDDLSLNWQSVDISGDDFKNLDIEKEYNLNNRQVAVSRSIVDGEYRLNVSGFTNYRAVISAI